ncbi:MAG: COG4315 family predicted lipoprotein [Jiangellaceae bacterium]
MTRRLAASLVGAAMVLAACGGNGDDAQTGTGGGDATVSVAEDASLGEILVDSSGRALYTAEQEADGTIVCEGGCLELWLPLTVGEGGSPTSAEGVDGTLATVDRDDGTAQVTLEGVPLYTFSLDRSPGDVTGNDVTDDFDGVTFTWHVATPSGEPADSNGDTGGYGY